MKSTLKTVLLGILIGGLVGFTLGMNAGRGAPLLSNPFARVDLSAKVKTEARTLVDDTRSAIHDATKPESHPIGKKNP